MWQRLLSAGCDALRERAAVCDAYSTADVTALRKKWDKELVHAALALAKARGKAAVKFGAAAARLVADPEGVEMATSRAAAAWKARRFAAAGGGTRRVLDLCCGIGGDAMAVRAAGLDVTCVDGDPVRAWMAGLNAGCDARSILVEELLNGAAALRPAPGGDARGEGHGADGIRQKPDATEMFHIDPARRVKNGSTSGRVWSLAEVQPGPEVLRAVVERWRDGAIKLAPGVGYAELAAAGLAGEVEIISERGGLTQAVLWTGQLSRGDGLRTATLLRCAANTEPGPDDIATLIGAPDVPETLPVWPTGQESLPPKFIHEVDDSIERAELLTALCARTGAAMLHPRLGLVASNTLLHDPFLRGFELLEMARWNEQRAAAVLKRLGAGSIEVKTRAKAVNPDEVQPALTKAACVKSGVPLVLFVLRFGSEVRMLVARRVQRH